MGNSVGATLKLQGEIKERQVLILVDSGSTHNFMSKAIVEKLAIPIHTVPSFSVQIGNGDIIHCNQVCKNLQVKWPGLIITQDYYPFLIGGADLVLGIKWLAYLNTIQANWKEMFLIFIWQGKRYKLQCVKSGITPIASLQSLN